MEARGLLADSAGAGNSGNGGLGGVEPPAPPSSPGPVPATHAVVFRLEHGMGGRDKRGHDGDEE
jgi:hypothetical protein